MKIHFTKYQGTGNDFIMIDNRAATFNKENTELIALLCDRRFGIGADGLILLENDKNADFRMVYFNSDGRESSMCGNGGRCLVAFAKSLGIVGTNTRFTAVDGEHEARISGDEVSLKMIDVPAVRIEPDFVFINTGSPHHVAIVNGLEGMDVKSEGAKIRYSNLYGTEGSNVNFAVPVSESHFAVRTYERGVEDETLSCGTGVTAVALAMHALGKTHRQEVQLHTPGGTLSVRFQTKGAGYSDIWLTGPAQAVFYGEFSR